MYYEEPGNAFSALLTKYFYTFSAIKINYGINIFEYYVKCRSEIENYKEQIFVLHGVHL